MKALIVLLALAGASGLASAKLPPPSEEAMAKAAESAAKAAYSGKVDAYNLCLVTDKVVAGYLAESARAGKAVKPMPTPACAEPGPFVYAPPPVKPLEAAGAHSPPDTAVAPPSTKTPAAELAPPKKP